MQLVELGEICESMHQGINTAADKVNYSVDGYQILQSRNITQGFIDYTDSKKVSFDTYQKYKKKYNPRPGDILLCNIGTIGNSLVVKQEKDFLIAWNLFLLKVNQSLVHPNYLNYFLIHLRETNFYTSFLTGGTVKFISKATLSFIKIPIPPLEEQKRIAAILDKADRVRRKRQEAIRLTEELGRSIFLDMFGDPVTNPKGWEIKKCKDLCSRITVGIVVTPAAYYKDSGVPALRSQNIKTNSILTENLVFFSEADNETKLSKTKLKSRDVVLVRTGQPGTAAVIPDELDGVNAIDLLITSPNENVINSLYLCFFFNSSGGKKLVSSSQVGQIQKHLNVGILNSALIPIPPLSLQKQFAQRMELLESLRAKHIKSLTQFDEIFNSLLQRAFRGEL